MPGRTGAVRPLKGGSIVFERVITRTDRIGLRHEFSMFGIAIPFAS